MNFIDWRRPLLNRLETGSIKNIFFAGEGDVLRTIPIYIVVKETDLIGFNSVQVQFYIHGAKGTKHIMEKYAIEELTNLLKAPLSIQIDSKEYIMQLRDTRNFIQDIPVSDDGTISCRRDFTKSVVW